GPDDETAVDGERAGAAPSRLLGERPEHQNVTFPCMTNATTAANSATPSTRAAAMIMAVWMRALFSGWRAMPSTAWPPIRPMPTPAPSTARPAARPAPMSAYPLPAAPAAADSCNSTSTFRSMSHSHREQEMGLTVRPPWLTRDLPC